MTALSFDIFWRDHGASKGMQDLGKHTDKTRASLGRLNQAAGKGLSGGIGALGGTVAKFGKAGALAFGAAGAAASVFGFKIASGNEQAKISFTTMLGSAKRADKFLRQLQQFAAKTPFEFPELQTAAASLISVGIKADKVIPIMTSLGNATSGMGTGAEGVKRATVALQQMTAAGRITAEDLNQLRDAGIPVFDLLTKATGKTTAEIAKMAANGKLGKKELQQLMAALESGKGLERFAGLMDKQSHSLAGLASTFKDVAGQAFAGLATSAFPLIKSGLASMSTGLGHLSDWVKDNKDALGSVFKVVGSTLSTLGGTVMTVFKSFARSAGLGKGSFKDFADFLSTHQEDITRGIIGGAKAFIAFGRTVATVASGGLQAFGTFADGISTATASILAMYANMAHGAALAFGWIPGIGPKLLAADVKFRIFAAHSATNIHKAGDAARTLADGIDNGVVPALDKAGHGLDVYGKKGIASAHAKDILAKAEIRHRDAANAATAAAKTNGKTLDSNTISGRSNRAALNGLVSSSQNYIGKLITTHASSKRVTEATKTARAEFIRVATSMGVSSARAKDLADKYFKVPKKVKTDVTQPGMDRARNQTKGLDRDINGLNDKGVGVKIQFTTNAKGAIYNLNRAYTDYAKRIASGNPRAATGGVLAFGNDGLRVIRAADGGVMPGYTPGRDVHRFHSPTGGNLELSGGEAVMRPEWVRAVGGPAEVARQNKLARQGQRFADGGVYRTIKTKVSSNGIPNVQRTVNKAAELGEGLGSAYARAYGKAYAAAMSRELRQGKAAAAAKAAAQATSSASGSVAGYSAGMAGTIARMRAAGARSFTTYPGHHPSMGKARDVTPHNWKIANVARASKGVWYVIYRMKIASKNHGNNWRPYHPISNRGDFRHTRHIHVAWYDKGGLLREGQAAVNYRGGTERVLTHRQNRNYEDLVRVMDRRGGGAGSTTINVNVPGGWIGSQDQFKQMLVDMNRRGQLEVIKR